MYEESFLGRCMLYGRAARSHKLVLRCTSAARVKSKKLVLTRRSVLLAVAVLTREEKLKNLVCGGFHIVLHQQDETRKLHKRTCRSLSSM